MIEIFFISYKESNADANLSQLLRVAEKSNAIVKHIKGVQGIGNAHLQAAKLASFEHFFIVDGDNYVYEDFRFDNILDLDKFRNYVHVWRCLNPVNDLIYGFGGVKLFPKTLFSHLPQEYIDFTMTVAKKNYFIQKDLASETRFNVTPFEAWRGAFRESAKLSLELTIKENTVTRQRLDSWKSRGWEKHNGDWVLLGAKMGSEFALKNINNPIELQKINDFTLLEKMFQDYCLS